MHINAFTQMSICVSPTYTYMTCTYTSEIPWKI